MYLCCALRELHAPTSAPERHKRRNNEQTTRSDVGRQYRWRRFREAVIGPRGVEELVHGKRRTTGMKKGMKESYTEELASHGGPDHALATREGAAKRWIGVHAGRAIEPRNGSCPGCRRAHARRKAIPPVALSRVAGGPRRVEEPGARVRSLHAESRGISWCHCQSMMPRPGWFAGWQMDWWRDARGTPRRECSRTSARSRTGPYYL